MEDQQVVEPSHTVLGNCQIEGHNKVLELICLNLDCKEERILCSKCAILFHQNCPTHLINTDDIMEGKLREGTENRLIKNLKIKKAANFLKKLGCKEMGAKLFKALEDKINTEFDKVIAYFMDKVKETRGKMITKAMKICLSEEINLKEFKNKVDELYNPDIFINILGRFKNDQVSRETLSKELEQVIQDIRKEEQNIKLQLSARHINCFAKSVLELEERPFKEFISSIPFNIFENYPSEKKLWTWDVNNKSRYIKLTENDTRAKKFEKTKVKNTAVLGTVEFSSGFHQWEIHASSGKKETDWTAFGVIEKGLIKSSEDLENFPFQKGVGMSVFGSGFNMYIKGVLKGYDNRVYLCELDMDEGTFIISHEGNLVAHQLTSLKNKVVVPYAYLYSKRNVVTLKSISGCPTKIPSNTSK